MVTVGDRVRQLRIARSMTLEEIGDAIGSSKQQIFRIERGQIPSAETVTRLATFFSVSADYLLGLVDEPYAYLKASDLTPQEQRFLSAIRGRSFKEVFDLLSAFIGEEAGGGAA